ncbi:hypothetical protein [uncultured Polaribacter sp.]|nr:hypothetical protein [uncultured Polaribacter sp.]
MIPVPGYFNKYSKRYNITDIASTIANLLSIKPANGTNGIIINEALK